MSYFLHVNESLFRSVSFLTIGSVKAIPYVKLELISTHIFHSFYSDWGKIQCMISTHNSVKHKRVSDKSAKGRRYFVFVGNTSRVGRKLYDILKVKNPSDDVCTLRHSIFSLVFSWCSVTLRVYGTTDSKGLALHPPG